MKNKYLNLTWIAGLFMFATIIGCNNSEATINSANGFVISGTILNAGSLQLYLDHTEFDNSNTVIAKTDFDSKGNFEVVLEEGIDAGIYRIRIGAKKINLAFDGSETNVNIKGDLSSFANYQFDISGSASSTEFVTAMKSYFQKPTDKSPLISYIKSTSNSIGAAFTSWRYLGNDFDQVPLMKKVNSKLVSSHPESKYTSDFKAVVANQEAKYAAFKANTLVQIGLPAPDIDLENPEGKKMALSDLKGKIVLLDFWASWCGPCRKANPHVVETYKKYKNKGFTVYSVSLDGINPRLANRYKTPEDIQAQLENAKKKWVAAIKKDNLIWDTHVSDLQYWNSIAAKTYGVRSIPKTFLIDRDGNLAAINPRNNLEEELLKLL